MISVARFIAVVFVAALLLLGSGCATKPDVIESSKLSPEEERALASQLATQGVELYAEGKYDEAGLRFMLAASLEPANADYRAWRAATLAIAGNTDEAWTTIRAAAALAPPSAVVHYCRAIVLQHAEMWEEAKKDHDVALAMAPDFRPAWVARAHVRNKLGDSAGAIADLGRAIELGANHPDVFHYRVTLLHRAKRYTEAMAEVERALRKWPKSAAALVLRGMIFRDTGRDEPALSDLKRAHKLEPKNAETRFKIGAILNRQRAFAAAQPWLRAATELNPNDPIYWTSLGSNLWSTGQYAEAQRAFEQSALIARRAGSPRYYSALYAAALRLRQGAARSDVESWLGNEGPPAHRGWEHELSLRLLDLTSSEALLARARTPGERCEAHFFNAVCELHQGQRELARRSLEACLATEQVAFHEYSFALWERRALR